MKSPRRTILIIAKAIVVLVAFLITFLLSWSSIVWIVITVGSLMDPLVGGWGDSFLLVAGLSIILGFTGGVSLAFLVSKKLWAILSD